MSCEQIVGLSFKDTRKDLMANTDTPPRVTNYNSHVSLKGVKLELIFKDFFKTKKE